MFYLKKKIEKSSGSFLAYIVSFKSQQFQDTFIFFDLLFVATDRSSNMLTRKKYIKGFRMSDQKTFLWLLMVEK